MLHHKRETTARRCLHKISPSAPISSEWEPLPPLRPIPRRSGPYCLRSAFPQLTGVTRRLRDGDETVASGARRKGFSLWPQVQYPLSVFSPYWGGGNKGQRCQTNKDHSASMCAHTRVHKGMHTHTDWWLRGHRDHLHTTGGVTT